MKLRTIGYSNYEEIIPAKGNHILAQYNADNIVVYQAYPKKIISYAAQNHRLGGDAFSFNRMTWIKPNFLWMMYRCGWAAKENQEGVLPISISRDFFEEILSEAVYSSYKEAMYQSRNAWQPALNNSEVRLQWDPDHDPLGRLQQRRAIQLGVKGNIMERFAEKKLLK